MVAENPAGRGGAVVGFALGIRGANLSAADHSPAGLRGMGLLDSIKEEDGAGEAEALGSCEFVVGKEVAEENDAAGGLEGAFDGSAWLSPNFIPL